MRLHHAGEAHDRCARHQAVGVERQHQLVAAAPPLTEVADVAGLVAGVDGAAAIDDTARLADLGGPRLGGCVLGGGDRWIIGVAQDEIVELAAFAGRVDARLDRAQAQEGAGRILVAQRHQDRGLDRQRRRPIAGRRERGDRAHRVSGDVQEPEADHRVPEAEHRPRAADRECDEQDVVDQGPAARAQHARHAPHQQAPGHDVEQGDQQPPAAQLVHGLDAGGRSKDVGIAAHAYRG